MRRRAGNDGVLLVELLLTAPTGVIWHLAEEQAVDDLTGFAHDEVADVTDGPNRHQRCARAAASFRSTCTLRVHVPKEPVHGTPMFARHAGHGAIATHEGTRSQRARSAG